MPSPFVGQTLMHSSTPEHSSRKCTLTDSHDPSSAECKLSNRCDNLRKGEEALYESSFQQKIDQNRSKQIPEDLHLVCKTLVRGRYDNLAAACMEK